MAQNQRESIFGRWDDAQAMFINDTPVETPNVTSDSNSDQDRGDRYIPRSNGHFQPIKNVRYGDQWTLDRIKQEKIELEIKAREVRQEAEKLAREKAAFEASTRRAATATSGPPPVSRVPTLQDRVDSMKLELEKEVVPTPKLKILPQQDQQISTNMALLTIQENSLESKARQITLMESLVGPKTDRATLDTLEAEREAYIRERKAFEIQRKQMTQASQIAHKYQTKYNMPDYPTPPAGFRKTRDALDPKNVMRLISPIFNPAVSTTQPLRHVWDKVLYYCRRHFLDEEEHIEVLGYALAGDPLQTFINATKEKKSLQDIIEELMTLYDTSTTYNDYKRELDQFTRPVNEILSKTMMRYRSLLEKTKHTYPEDTWPGVLELKMLMTLKMMVTNDTRYHIETEERRTKKVGATIPVATLIDLAEEFEDIRGQQPKKAIVAAYQTASLAPAISATDAQEQSQQLKAMKSHNHGTKEVVEAINTLTTHMSAMNSNIIKGFKRQRLDDGDIDMSEFDPLKTGNKNRADKPLFPKLQQHQQAQQAQRPQQAAPPAQTTTTAQAPAAAASGEAKKQEEGAKKPYYNRNNGNYNNRRGRGGYSNNNNRGNNSNNGYPNRQKLRVNGTLYGSCVPCNGAMHIYGEETCPNGNPDFDVEVIDYVDDEEDCNEEQEAQDDQNSEN